MIKNESKLVLFDWGGVADTTDFENKYNFKQLMCDAIRYAFDIRIDYTDEEIWNDLQRVEYFKLSHDAENMVQFQDQLKQIIKKVFHSEDYSEAIQNYCEYTKSHHKFIAYNEDIIFLQYETRARCKTGMLTDLTWLDAFRIREQYDLNRFDYTFLSYLIGKSKRECDVYLYVEHETGIKGGNILFIDDMEENVKAAEQLGWQTYLYKGQGCSGIKSAIDAFLS